jgi:signal transduction histidine kinase
MRENRISRRKRKPSRFPPSLFVVYLGVLLLMSGVHTGLIVWMKKVGQDNFYQIAFPMFYWSFVAVGLTLFTRLQMQKKYEEPMLQLAQATKKVADGDFSVYITPYHTADKMDYLDYMLLDFNKMVEELGSIETLKTDFFSNVSHEIKTPIAVIQGYAQALEEETVPKDKQKEYIKVIRQASGRLSELITNLLKLNRLEKQVIKPERERYDLCRQLGECLLNFEQIWEKKDIEIEADMEDEAWIEADENLMELVWNNLFSNAFKFTEPKGLVSIKQDRDAEGITVTVSDNGCGMDEEVQKHLFDKFYQGDTSHATEGNGLGMALVLRILQLMEYQIEVKSVPQKGTTFTVRIPKSTLK